MCIVLSKLFWVWMCWHCGVCMPRCKPKNLCECPVMTLTNSLPKFFWLHVTCEFTEIPLFCALFKVVWENAHDCQASQETDGLIAKFLISCASLSGIFYGGQSKNFVSSSLKRTSIFEWSENAYRSEDKSPVIRCQKKSNPIFCCETTVKIISSVTNAKFLNGLVLKLR